MGENILLEITNKRLFKKTDVKKEILSFIKLSSIIIVTITLSIMGNMYLKSNPTTSKILFWEPEDKEYNMTMKVNAMAKDIEDLNKEKDILIKERDILIKERDELYTAMKEKGYVDQAKIEKPVNVISNKKIKVIAHNLGGLMTGHSTYLYNKCVEYNIDPFMVAAIIKHESANGTSAAIRNRCNIAGFMGSKGLMYFDSIDQSIDFMVTLLKKYYIDKGYDTIEKIQKRYCPVGASNDPTGLNKHWLPNVTALYLTMVEEEKNAKK